MTTTDLERRLTAVLHQHAEHAMDQTRTDERLDALMNDWGTGGRRRWVWGAGALAAAAAAVALLLWTAGVGVDRADTVPPAQGPDPVEVANGFVDAYTSFDLDRAATYLAADASVDLQVGRTADGRWDTGASQWLQAVGFRWLAAPCTRQSTSHEGVRVNCTYRSQSLGSDRLGRGPFGDNLFALDIREGQIVTAQEHFEYLSNGFSSQVWDPFANWVVRAHQKDAAVMYSDWPGQSLESHTPRSIALWARYIEEYVAAETSRGS